MNGEIPRQVDAIVIGGGPPVLRRRSRHAGMASTCSSPTEVANGSGLFNLTRNLGGAIGLSAVDTLIEQRTPHHTS